MAGPADSILGTVNLFYNQQNRRFNQELALEQQKLAQQREARLGQVQEAQLRNYDQSFNNNAAAERRAEANEIRLNSQEKRADSQEKRAERAADDASAFSASQLAVSELAVRTGELEFDIKSDGYNAGMGLDQAISQGFLNIENINIPGAELAGEKFYNSIGQPGGGNNRQLLGAITKTMAGLAEGQSLSGMRRGQRVDPETGEKENGFFLDVSNGGVITEDSTSNPNSKPKFFTEDEFRKVVDMGFRTMLGAREDFNVLNGIVGQRLENSLGTPPANPLALGEKAPTPSDAKLANAYQASVFAQLEADTSPTGLDMKRKLTEELTNIQEEGGDAARLAFFREMGVNPQDVWAGDVQTDDPAVPQTEGPVMPGGETTPYQSDSGSAFTRGVDEFVTGVGADVDLETTSSIFRLNQFGLSKTNPENAALINTMKELDSQTSKLGDSTPEGYAAATKAKDWFSENSDALGQRYTNAPEAFSTEIASLGAQGFYERYKNIPASEIDPVIMDANTKTDKALAAGDVPALTGEHVETLTAKIRSLGLPPNATIKNLVDTADPSEASGMLGLLMATADSDAGRLALVKAWQNNSQTGSFSDTRDDQLKTQISLGNFRLAQQNRIENLKTTYQDDARRVIKIAEDMSNLAVDADGNYITDNRGSFMAKMTSLGTLATSKNSSAGERAAANEMFLSQLVNLIGMDAEDNEGFIDAINIFREDPTYIAGNTASRIVNTGNKIILLDGKGGVTDGGTFTYRDLSEIIDSRTMNLLKLLPASTGY